MTSSSAENLTCKKIRHVKGEEIHPSRHSIIGSSSPIATNEKRKYIGQYFDAASSLNYLNDRSHSLMSSYPFDKIIPRKRFAKPIQLAADLVRDLQDLNKEINKDCSTFFLRPIRSPIPEL